MFSHAKLLSIAYAVAAAIPSIVAMPVGDGNSNIQFVHGTVNGTSEDISKRGSFPPECSFGGQRDDWYYLQITGLAEGTACLGWAIGPSCGAGSWDDPDWTDLQKAMAEVVTMDGQWSGSSEGAWDGTFFLGTTAFSNRDTSLFDLAMTQTKSKVPIYYWSRDGNFAQVVGHNANCPS